MLLPLQVVDRSHLRPVHWIFPSVGPRCVQSAVATSFTSCTGYPEMATTTTLRRAILLGLCLFSSWILVSEVPMFALKFKTYGLADNKLRYGFILLSAALLVWLGWTGFSAVIRPDGSIAERTSVSERAAWAKWLTMKSLSAWRVRFSVMALRLSCFGFRRA